MNIVRKSIKPVIQNSKHVSIDYSSLDSFVEKINIDELSHWFCVSPFDIKNLDLSDRIAFAFVLDSISFSYWASNGTPKWKIEYKGEIYEGAKGMMACIGRAIEKGVPILDPDYLSTIDDKILDDVFDGNVRIPLFNERLRILHEVGDIVIKLGGYKNIVEMSSYNAEDLAKNIVRLFPSFEDSATYDERKIYFYKRAQLLAADIAHLMAEEHPFLDIEKLTACADYIEPQVFSKEGIFRYSEALREKISNNIELDPNSNEVTEIRANNIHVVDLIANRLNRAPNVINDYLWLRGQNEHYYDEPHLRTRTTAF